MLLKQYYTYKDEYHKDLSKSECEIMIRLIFSNYRREIVLAFLGHVAKGINLSNEIDNLSELQQNLIGIDYKIAAVVHRRAHLGLWQYFFENENYSKNDLRNVLDAKHVFLLFILMNQILDKSEYQQHDNESFLHAAFSFLSIDLTQTNDIIASYFFFVKFYEKLMEHPLRNKFDKLLIAKTTYDLRFFRDLCLKLSKRELPDNIFDIVSKFSVIKYEEITQVWENRKPKIRIPFEYRFLEENPLIKRDQDHFPVDVISIFLSIIRKPYHVLSRESNEFNFREIFSKDISETVMKDYIRTNFSNEKVKVIETSFDDYEYADIALLKDSQLILIEIKSVYMGLELRYNESKAEFIKGFNKRYVDGTGVEQQVNRLFDIEKNYKKFIEDCKIENKRYSIFCLLLVFDESFISLGVNLYLKEKFNDYFKENFSTEFKHINPFPLNATVTFNELFFLFKDYETPEERFKVLNNFFDPNYKEPMHEFLYDLKHTNIKINEKKQK